MKVSKIKSKLDKILGIPDKESETKKNLVAINTLLEKLNQKESKFKERLHSETETSSINKLKQKLKLINRQIEKAAAYKSKFKE